MFLTYDPQILKIITLIKLPKYTTYQTAKFHD